jgi:hypothetical protein
MSHMGITDKNVVTRLKNGNFMIKFEYQILKIYWNLTKERIEKVLRIEHPSEVPQFLQGQILHSCPNINHLKKFYLKKFNLETLS